MPCFIDLHNKKKLTDNQKKILRKTNNTREIIIRAKEKTSSERTCTYKKNSEKKEVEGKASHRHCNTTSRELVNKKIRQIHGR